MKTAYSKEIADRINNFLTRDEWNFSFDDERGIFTFELSLKSKIKSISFFIKVKERSYIIYAVSPLGPNGDDEEAKAKTAEFICRANYGLQIGNFEFDFSDGEIRFKVSADCKNAMPEDDTLKRSIYGPAAMFKRYGNGIADVIFTDISAKKAIEICESASDDSESE